MRRLFAMVFGSLLGAAAMFIAFKFHTIRTTDDWWVLTFVPKPQAVLIDAYVDVREWNAAEWTKHPDLVKAMIKNGKGDLVRQSVTTNFMDNIFGKPSKKSIDDDAGESRESEDMSFDFPGLQRR
jgi:hypothetical protein